MSAVTNIFAPRKAPLPDSDLRRLSAQLIGADAVLVACNAQDSTSEQELEFAEDRFSDARQALMDHLLYEHGLTTREVEKLGRLL